MNFARSSVASIRSVQQAVEALRSACRCGLSIVASIRPKRRFELNINRSSVWRERSRINQAGAQAVETSKLGDGVSSADCRIN